MNSDCSIEILSNKECGDLDKNNNYLKKFNLIESHKSGYESDVKNKKIEKELILKVCENLESLNNITFNEDFRRRSMLEELMLCSLLKLRLLSGTTTHRGDAVLLKKAGISENLKDGRYQKKYRDERTSDVGFRIDVNSSDQLLPEYAWDYLLIATHTT